MSIPIRTLVVACAIAGVILAGAARAHLTHPCPCRHAGGEVLPGGTACLEVDGKRFLARCVMVLNNPSWRQIEDGCPVA